MFIAPAWSISPSDINKIYDLEAKVSNEPPIIRGVEKSAILLINAKTATTFILEDNL